MWRAEMDRVTKLTAGVVLLAALIVPPLYADETGLEAAKHSFAKGNYKEAISLLQRAAETDKKNGELYLWLTRSYLELDAYDDAVKSGEQAIAINPQNSEYHRWLGEALGAKADHASMFSAYSLAKRTQKEFEAASQLDEHNYDAIQDLIEYDCTAPGVAGGGEEKAQPWIQKLMAMDAAEGHYATGICRSQKKDYAASDAEFAKSLESKPKAANRIFDIADYFGQRKQPAKVLQALALGEQIAPRDPRNKFYRGTAYVEGNEKPAEAERLLKEYLQEAPMNSNFPRPWAAHLMLGRLKESQKNTSGAREEYEAALKLNPKYKQAQEALKQLGGK